MKRLAAVALILVGVALPACAQRGGSHGGFSGHSAQGSHGGFSGGFHGVAGAPGSNRFASAPRGASSRPLGMAYGLRRGVSGNFGARPDYRGARRYRRPYVSPYRSGIGYGVPIWPGWIGPNYLDYGDSNDYEDSQTPANYAAGEATGGYDTPPGEQEPPPFPGPPRPASEQSQNLAHTLPAADSEDAVTLVFRDGRAPEQIHNYVLTSTTLYVGDSRRRDIPVDQLDLAATEKVNRDAGVEFHLPARPGS